MSISFAPSLLTSSSTSLLCVINSLKHTHILVLGMCKTSKKILDLIDVATRAKKYLKIELYVLLRCVIDSVEHVLSGRLCRYANTIVYAIKCKFWVCARSDNDVDNGIFCHNISFFSVDQQRIFHFQKFFINGRDRVLPRTSSIRSWGGKFALPLIEF